MIASYIKVNLLDVGECIALWEVVRMAFPEDVAHATAGQDLKTAATHPHSERQLYSITTVTGEMERITFMCGSKHRDIQNIVTIVLK